MKNKLKIIDGSQGEGGGQILRSTLSLAMCTGTPVRITNIRAGRKKGGLLRQHLTCVRASQTICRASVTGAELGSEEVTFRPGTITAGQYSFSIGSAGSTSLVFQTVLPALLLAPGTSTIELSGGTHNSFAPSFDFLNLCFLPALHDMGFKVYAQLSAYGFMPNGGGQWKATVTPSGKISAYELTSVSTFTSRKAVVTQSGVPRSVAERELSRVARKLGWSTGETEVKEVESVGSGNVVSLRVSDGNAIEVVDVAGTRGLKAERVVGKAISQLKRFLTSGAAVGEHLCDQLLLPMALHEGGRFTTVKPTLHTRTNIDVIQSFIECSIRVNELDNDLYEVVVET